MKLTLTLPVCGLVLAAAVASCGGRKAGNGSDSATFGDMPVVAERVQTPDGGSLIVAHPEKSENVRDLRLSDLADNIKIVRLETTDASMTGEGMTWITGNRIIIFCDGEIKQFDLDGKYIGKIGARGNGPGEYYIAPYDIYADPSAERIYLVSYSADNIISYNYDGSFASNIPLAQKMPKGCIKVDTEKRIVTAVAMCFEGTEAKMQVWTQDFEGNTLSGISKPWLEVPADFSNEVYSNIGGNAENFSYALFRISGEPDSLYECDGSSLLPKFTIPTEKGEMRYYNKMGSLYVSAGFGSPRQVSENSYVIEPKTPFVVEPENLRGGYCRLILDCIGDVDAGTGWIYSKSPEYFILNTSPGTLAELIEKSIAERGVSGDELTKLQDFQSTLSEDDNNIVIFGSWK